MAVNIQSTPAHGLTLSWSAANGLTFTGLPVRVRLHGAQTFRVWGAVDSGEGLPAWADPALGVVFFGGNDDTCRVETLSAAGVTRGYRAVARHARAEAILEMRRKRMANWPFPCSCGIRNLSAESGCRSAGWNWRSADWTSARRRSSQVPTAKIGRAHV